MLTTDALIFFFISDNKSKMSKTNTLICVCHYDGQSSYGEINQLSDNNISRLLEAKMKREKLGGSNLHMKQIKQLPENFNVDTHGIHSRPCYKL